ncbi:MAG TPA: GTPase domain-containing protein [Thermoanaerobaculia bacterium]
MARMTPDRDAVVVRLVYDGPPRSGKTTSLAALARGMGRSLYTAGEEDGRTLYFDWLEYVGGSFDGLPIRCQILSVPGQEELAERRRALLSEADAVVFVLNSGAGQVEAAAEHMRGLKEMLAERPGPRTGIVVQANHRDRKDAMPVAELRETLGSDGLAVVESVATENQGIRDAFVLSVRLALDRVREMIREGLLETGEGATDEPALLLAWLQALEGADIAAPAPARPTPIAAAPVPDAPRGVPRLPDSGTPIGRVWPPIDGRMILHTAVSTGAVPVQGRDGAWRCQAGGWHFHSAADHEFENLDDAKHSLLSWAQRHAASIRRLSPQRCIVLGETGWGTWRLWQIVQGRESLRRRLGRALRPPASESDRDELLRSCRTLLLEARQSFGTEPPLPWSLDLIAEEAGRPVYIGLLPPPDWRQEPESHSLPAAEAIRRELQPLLDEARIS